MALLSNYGEGKTGMVHISEVAPTFVKEIREYVTENQTVKVKVLSVGEDGKISLSMKKAVETPPRAPSAPRNAPSGRPGNYEWQSKRNEPTSFEDMLSKFKQTSDEKMSALKKGMESKRSSSPGMVPVNADKTIQRGGSTPLLS